MERDISSIDVAQIALPCGRIATVDADVLERESCCEFRDGFVWTGRICDVSWHSSNRRHTTYVHRLIGNSNRELFLHRAVMLAGRGQLVDHRDGNGLNCTGTNLRMTDSVGNSRNRAKGPNKSSQYKGVSFHKFSGRWTAQIVIARRKLHLGLFAEPADAARAYDAAALEHFGEFARLNFQVIEQARAAS